MMHFWQEQSASASKIGRRLNPAARQWQAIYTPALRLSTEILVSERFTVGLICRLDGL